MDKIINKYLNLIVVIFGIINGIVVYILKLPCPWKKNFNIDCAGCGATRMVESLLHFNFYQAFRFNPLMFCLLVTCFLYLIYVLIFKVKKLEYYKIKDRDLYILLLITLIFTILRNIPGLEYLKPTVVN